MWVTSLRCWWLNFYVSVRCQCKKLVEVGDQNGWNRHQFSKLSTTHSVSKIRHQHRCNFFKVMFPSKNVFPSEDQFQFRWLKTSVREIGNVASNTLIFNHLKLNSSKCDKIKKNRSFVSNVITTCTISLVINKRNRHISPGTRFVLDWYFWKKVKACFL